MKKTSLIVALAMAAPLAAQAETINIYGWQNHSWEMIDIEDGREFNRTNGNAANVGFAASADTGMNGIMVNFKCEQFTFVDRNGGFGDWCNRNSKIGLSHPMAGEIMFATWLLPYNEGVAQWVDPFYDAGADSHTSIMGSVGYSTVFYNTGFGFQGAQTVGFNRRQEDIIQYWSPNWNGFVFRFAWTNGTNDDTPAEHGSGKIDPIIRSSSLAYENGPLWLAATWQDHEDWSAMKLGAMNSSDAESFRLAGRYIFDMGGGASFQIATMWESLEYEFNGVESFDAAMGTLFNDPNNDPRNLQDNYRLRNSSGTTLTDEQRTMATAGSNVKFERDAWMVSGKIKFGGPLDFRFSYMDADDLEISCGVCSGDWQETAADAFNVGLFYTMPAGTELRLTYSEVNNDDYAKYDFGIGTAGVAKGKDVDMVAVGIVHWFD